MSDFTGAVQNDVGIVNNMWDTANQFAQAKGGWGQLAQDSAGQYVKAHGGAVGTAEHLGHDVVNAAANTLIGAKDWGDAFRSVKSGHWGDALKSAGWGALALGATASMIVPGVGEAVKGAEMGAEAARVGGEALAKDAAETGAKDAAEGAAAKEGAAAEEGVAAEEEATAGSRAGKAAKWANRAHNAADAAGRLNSFLNGQGKAEVKPQGLSQARIY